MADTPAPAKSGGQSKSTFGFLTRKVGPIPVWGWAAIAFGVYYWYTHYGPGAQQAAAQQPAGNATIVVAGRGGQDDDNDQQAHRGRKPPITVPPRKGGGGGGGGGWKGITVPAAWNGWDLDKIAAYLHWSKETLADVEEANAQGGKEITGSTVFHTGDVILRPVGAAKDQSQGTDGGTGATGGSTQPGAAAQAKQRGRAAFLNAMPGRGSPDGSSGLLGTYAAYGGQNTWKTAAGWNAAAINYLIGEGVAPDQASSSVWSYQHNEPMSSLMWAHVTLATDGIGPPPGQPRPTITKKTIPPAQASRQPATQATANPAASAA